MDLAPFQPLASSIQPFLDKGLCKFLVTSSGPGEGKSTVTTNLARALARSGRLGVLAVDADPIKPTLHARFGVENRRGLGNLLREIYGLDLARENPDQFGVGDWVELLRAQGRTGTLWIRQEASEAFQIVFQRGRITSISGGPTGDDGRLGDRLVHEGRITNEQRDVALSVQREGNRRIGEVLRGLGYVGGADLDTALEQQLRDCLHRIVTLQRPAYEFSESGNAYLPTASKQQDHDDGSAIDGFVTGRLSEYLKHPFLASQIPSYFTDTGMENLKLLTTGTVRFDPSDRPFAILTDRLARSFDVVLLDCPPVALTSPTGSLTSVAHGVLLVVKAEGYDLRIVQQAKEQLVKGGANLLGVVLNQVDVRHDESLTYYYGAYKR